MIVYNKNYLSFSFIFASAAYSTIGLCQVTELMPSVGTALYCRTLAHRLAPDFFCLFLQTAMFPYFLHLQDFTLAYLLESYSSMFIRSKYVCVERKVINMLLSMVAPSKGPVNEDVTLLNP